MTVWPVGVMVSNAVEGHTVYSFAVEAANHDEATGKATRIANKIFRSKGTITVKVNNEWRPLDPESARLEETQ